MVTKSGAGKDNTKYLCDHDPKEEFDKAIIEEYKNMKINLEALFTNEDPFTEVPFEKQMDNAKEALL